MKHYSIWLEKYSKVRDGILGELQECRKEIHEAVKKIPEGELLKPLGKPARVEPKSMCFVD